MTALARVSLLACLVVVSVVALAMAREFPIGRDEIAAADAAAAKSDWPEAIAHSRAAAEALLPGSPWPERGLRRLQAIGHDAEARGDDAAALLAYGAMRTAALATRAPGGVGAHWLASAEEGLVRVAAVRKNGTEASVQAESMIAALHRNELPGTLTLAALASSVLAMLGGLARLAWPSDNALWMRIGQIAAAMGFGGYAIVLLLN
jgi:hypothetical protein